ncbi:MAG: hypothetical protein WCD81_04900 [Candidatus Bathyarchaeia archaeon]
MRETSVLKNKWQIATVAVLCWALSTSLLAGYYWLQYTDFINRVGGVPISLNIGINYGNSTVWSNNTKELTGMTLFKVTEDITNVTYDTMAGYGIYIKSINNVAAAGVYGWVWWLWGNSTGWTMGLISSGAYAVSQGETFMWYYESGWPPASPP